MTALALRKVAPTVDATIEKVGPRDAERYLERNAKNRAIRRGVVRRFSEAMRRDEWVLNGESIKFDVEGSLIDGQHRLLAIVDSGVAVPLLVVRGVADAAKNTVDIGAKRTTGDILHLHGYIDANNLAGALTYLHRIKTNQLRVNGPDYVSPTPTELVAMVEAHPGILDSVRIAHQLRRRLRIRRAQFAALHYWFSEKDEADANEFFERLETGAMLEKNHPIYALRRWLEQTAAVSRLASTTVIHAVTVKAWNAFRSNEEMSLARWRSGIEEFPEPI